MLAKCFYLGPVSIRDGFLILMSLRGGVSDDEAILRLTVEIASGCRPRNDDRESSV